MQSVILKMLQSMATLASGIGKHKKLFILIYHRVLDQPDFMRPDEVDVAKFTWQMELLARYFNVLPLPEAIEKMQSGNLPPRAVAITFDDGYADNYTNALPILQRFNLHATFFIASGFLDGGRMWNDTVIESIRNTQRYELDLTKIGLGIVEIPNNEKRSATAYQIIQQIKHLPPREREEFTDFITTHSENLPSDLMMTSKQIRYLYENGMEIGGHTVNHPIMAKLNNESVELELRTNKLFLEKLLETPINYFAYPNGKPQFDYLPEQIPLVKSVGYKAAVTTQWAVCNHNSDIWQLSRVTPWDNSPIKFMFRMMLIYSQKTIK